MNRDHFEHGKIDRFRIFFQPDKLVVRLFEDASMENNLGCVFDVDDNFLANDLVDDHRIHADYLSVQTVLTKLTKSLCS